MLFRSPMRPGVSTDASSHLPQIARCTLAGTALVAMMFLASPASLAQYYSGGCSSCGTITAPPVAASCTPIQPVYSTCYQTVPVTTYQREEKRVRVPYYKTAYREQEVTVYRPVTQAREIEVPTVSYQNVTEYRTVNRDMGRWVTRFNPVQKCSPCQVDPRPGFLGWLNRTGYSFRTSFMPNYTTSRQYVPNMVSCRIPYTRQVAVRGTRRVTVHDTKMVAEKKMERVPVQQLAYREETVTVMKPQTAYRTVPIGTSVAYGYGGYGYGSTMTAWGAPILLDGASSRTALNPEPDPISGSRSADRGMFPEDDDQPERAANDNPLRPSSYERELAPATLGTPKTFPHEAGASESEESTEGLFDFDTSSQRENKPIIVPVNYETSQKADSSGGWRAARRTAHVRSDLSLPKVSLTRNDK